MSMDRFTDLAFVIILFALQVSSYVSSHLPEYWKDPEEFNPYRFDDEELLKRWYLRLLHEY